MHAARTGQGATVAVAHTEPARASALEGEQGTDIGGEDGATQAMVPGEHVTQPMRQAEHPLADGHRRQHRVHRVGRPLGHPPAPATRTEPAALAGKRQKAVQPAGVTPQPREAVRQDAAPEERPKLLFHEPGQASRLLRVAASCRNVSRCARMTAWSTVCSTSRGQ